MGRFGWALTWVLGDEHIIFIIRWQDDFDFCSAGLAGSGVRGQLHGALLRRVVEILDAALHVQFKPPLLFHEKAVLFEQKTGKNGLSWLNKCVSKLRKCRVDCVGDASLSDFHGLGLANHLSYAKFCHVSIEVDLLEERMRFQLCHVLRSKTLSGVENDKFVDKVAAHGVNLLLSRPLYLSIVDLWKHRVVLSASEGHLACDHLEYNATKCPQIRRQRRLLALYHFRRQIVHGAD